MFQKLVLFLTLVAAGLCLVVPDDIPEDVHMIYDHLETQVDVPLDGWSFYLWQYPEGVQISGDGSNLWLQLDVEFDLDVPGKEAELFKSSDLPPFNSSTADYVGTLPFGNSFQVFNDSHIFFGIHATKPVDLNSLTIDFTVSLKEHSTDLFGFDFGSTNYVQIYDESRTIWHDIAEGDAGYFVYNIPAAAHRYWRIDLFTAAHELQLYAKQGSVPTSSDYDWTTSDDDRNTATGTVDTDQHMMSGDTFLMVEANKVWFPAQTATYRLECSVDENFQPGAAPVPQILWMLIALLVNAFL